MKIWAKSELHSLRKERKEQTVKTCLWRLHRGVVVKSHPTLFTWPGASPPFSFPWNKNRRQRNNISIRRFHHEEPNGRTKCNYSKKKSLLITYFCNSNKRCENCVLIRTGCFEKKKRNISLFQGYLFLLDPSLNVTVWPQGRSVMVRQS